jgi:putative transposase
LKALYLAIVLSLDGAKNPKTTVQLCLIHMVQRSYHYVGRKTCKEVATDARAIHTAAMADDVLRSLENYQKK